MGHTSTLGRIFFGTAIAGMGWLTIYYRDFPYMLIPPKHAGIPGFSAMAYGSGIMLMLAGACLVLEKKVRPVSLLLGGVLLLIFCFYHLPYQFLVSPNRIHFGDWENAAKELALSSGAFVMAGCFPARNEIVLTRFLGKLIPLGAVLFAVTIISFGVDHFLYANEVADYVPAWVPYPLFWAYFVGAALLGSGLAIILKIKSKLAATLLGAMILTWVIILHIPRVIAAPAAYMGSEVTSTLIALAYSGIAFVIGGSAKR